MKKTKMLVALLLALTLVFPVVLAACNAHECHDQCPICGKCLTLCTEKACREKCAGHSADFDYAANTTLRMATGYNNKKTGITFDADTAGEGITLADGVTYHTGDLKPTWKELEKILNVKFENKYQGNNSSKEWGFWKDNLGEVDMVSGTASDLNEAGAAGKVVNIGEYLDRMPNFKQYLEDNPIVRLSIMGQNNGIYFSPYFDGVNDIERMPLIRADFVSKLLDGEGSYAGGADRAVVTGKYTPYMPTSGKVTVASLNADGTKVVDITKNYDKAGNIIATMNAKSDLKGVEAVNMLREYIDKAYNGLYGTTRSDLFLGYNACWDADEMVALLRCAVANLNDADNNPISGIYSRETSNNQRQVDLFRFAGTLFGVRGLESRQDYLYIGNDNKLHDARQEVATYAAIERMHAICAEGLIIMDGSGKSETYLEKDAGLMSYDYNQTQTVMNKTKLNKNDQTGEKYIAIMVPVARWDDGDAKTPEYMRFTESWRSVKTDGWAISKAGVEGSQDKLYAALALIDYAYSYKGQILMSYGPDAFIKTDAEGNYVMFEFNGKKMPVIADATAEELWSKASGNYTNYARMYLGSTLSFVKSQAFEYQCTHEVGKEGAAKLSAAIGLGTIKHPELALAANPWYTSVPTVLPTTKTENTTISEYTELSSNGLFSQSSGDDKTNLFLSIIKEGYANVASGVTDAATMVAKVKGDWNAASYLEIKEAAWVRLQNSYSGK